MPVHPTPYPELNEVLAELSAGVQQALGSHLVGIYLQGSFAAGGFDQHSDVDFTTVVQDELAAAQVASLQALHAHLHALPGPWAQHLDGSYFPRQILARSPQPGEELWYKDNGADHMVRSTHCNTLVVRWILRRHGLSLAGPPAATLIPPIPDGALRREILAVIHDWGGEILADPEHYNNRFYQSFIVLSFCRMLHSLHTATIESKRSSAAWAKAHLDTAWADLIDRTWAGRPNPEASVRTPADPADFQRTLEFIGYITRLADEMGIG